MKLSVTPQGSGDVSLAAWLTVTLFNDIIPTAYGVCVCVLAAVGRLCSEADGAVHGTNCRRQSDDGIWSQASDNSLLSC
jgi:hypothetical protein